MRRRHTLKSLGKLYRSSPTASTKLNTPNKQDPHLPVDDYWPTVENLLLAHPPPDSYEATCSSDYNQNALLFFWIWESTVLDRLKAIHIDLSYDIRCVGEEQRTTCHHYRDPMMRGKGLLGPVPAHPPLQQESILPLWSEEWLISAVAQQWCLWSD